MWGYLLTPEMAHFHDRTGANRFQSEKTANKTDWFTWRINTYELYKTSYSFLFSILLFTFLVITNQITYTLRLSVWFFVFSFSVSNETRPIYYARDYV